MPLTSTLASNRPRRGVFDEDFRPASPTNRRPLLMVGWQGPPFNGRVHVVSSLMKAPFTESFTFARYDTRIRNRTGGGRPDATFIRSAVTQVTELGGVVRSVQPAAAIFFTGPGPTFWRDLLVLRALRKTGVPVLVRLFGGSLTEQLRAMREPARKLALGELRHSRSFLVETDAMVSDLALLCPGVPAYRVPNFIHIDDLPQTQREQKPHGEPFRVIYFGNMTPSKGVETILQSVDKVCDAVGSRISVEFHFIGGEIDNGYLDAFRRQRSDIQNVGVVHIHGKMSRSHAHSLAATGDVFAFPTRWPGEGQPAALIEAMGMGLVPIASRWRGISEIVNHGANGILLDSADDPKSLGDAIVALEANREQRLSLAAAARAHIASAYDAVPAFEQFSRIVNSVIGASATARINS